MMMRWISGLLLVLAVWPTWLKAEEREENTQLGLPEALSSRPFLWREQPVYRNFAFDGYTNYPNHSFPYADTPRAFYSNLGDYLINGYEIYDWREERRPGLEFGSSITKDTGVFQTVLDNVVVARDGYGSWGYSAIVGDGLIARFTPLTLSKVDFNGIRLDVSTTRWKFTALGSRIERPNHIINLIPTWRVDDTQFADTSTLLLGGRAQADLGALQVGLNGVNLHVYQSTQPGNSMKGIVHPQQPLVDWVVVRFSDDSPGDGRAGAAVQEVQLIVDGQPRPELQPIVIRHRTGPQSQVGTTSRATGEFRRVIYTTFVGYYQRNPAYYRGREEIPLFADYLYRSDHEAGEDVTGNTNLPGLLDEFDLEDPSQILRADGEEQLVFMFDLSGEQRVESVAVEGLLANDYLVEVATLHEQDPRARSRESQFRSTFYRTVAQSEGNVQDMSNLERVRFGVGEDTAIFTYSTDVHLSLPGLEVRGEYARSALYSRYPAHVDRVPVFDRGPRIAEHGSGYFLNGVHWFDRGRVGAEYFVMNPDFRTSARMHLPFDLAYADSPLGGIVNDTVYWDLVQDNEDGDRYPDVRIGGILGSLPDRLDRDTDGVFPGQDEDKDGFPDTNRNFNQIPDYEEPFLMFGVEPNEYVYGLDRNNNDEPDAREDDDVVDYPYEPDQRGYHVFGQVDLGGLWSAGAGRYDVEQIAGAGRNQVDYMLINYRRDEADGRLRRLFFENNVRRVKDDIPDEYNVVEARPRRLSTSQVTGLSPTAQVFFNETRQDPLLYEDSYVNESYLESRLRPAAGLSLVQKLRLRFNWQQGGALPGGRLQRSRRLDYWTGVSSVDYTYHWGRLDLEPQFKFLWLRLRDQRTEKSLRSEYGLLPIFRLSYPLMPRTRLRVGVQGMGGLPYRFEDKAIPRNSFDRHTWFATLTNRSKYFGYDLYTIVGTSRDKKNFDDAFRASEEFDVWSFFVRALIGFTEYGRPI